MLIIATWNVNSVKARLPHLLDWLKRDKPDIVLLQELKCVNEAFPAMEIEDLGYNLAIHGEKTYNGVAILSKFKLEDIVRGLPGNESDPRARYIEAIISLPCHPERSVTESKDLKKDPSTSLGMTIRVASVYVPNGQDTTSDKFPYKLQFLDRLHAHMKTLLSYNELSIVGGDYNIAPEDSDVHDPKTWEGSVLTHDEVRSRFRKMLHLGMYDAWRLTVDGGRMTKDHSYPSSVIRNPSSGYTWWDYRAGAFAKDDGLRIDHLLLSPQAADKIAGCHVVKDLRALDKASDHAPVVGKFRL